MEEKSNDINNLKRKKQNQENMVVAKRIKIEKLQEVPKMKNKGKRNREKRTCIERTGEEKIKLKDTKPSKKDLRYALNNVNNGDDNEQKPRIFAYGFYWVNNPDFISPSA